MSVQLLGDPAPAGMWQTGQEDYFGYGLPVVPVVRSLGCGGFPAVLEAVAVAVHLQDVDVVDEAVRAEHLGTSGTTFVLSEVPVGWNTTRATRLPPD